MAIDPATIWVSVIGTVGTLSAAGLGLWTNYKTNTNNTRSSLEQSEKLRRLELYKVVFPEKYQVGKSLMEKAFPLLNMAIRYLRIEPSTAVDKREAVEAELELYRQDYLKNAWLLGEVAADKVFDFYLSAARLIESNKNLDLSPTERSNIHTDLQKKYDDLAAAMRQEIDPLYSKVL